MLALSSDRKVDVQMEAVGQSSFCLNVDRLQLTEFQECFARLEANLDTARQQIQAQIAQITEPSSRSSTMPSSAPNLVS